jgi:hypothetical protein
VKLPLPRIPSKVLPEQDKNSPDATLSNTPKTKRQKHNAQPKMATLTIDLNHPQYNTRMDTDEDDQC